MSSRLVEKGHDASTTNIVTMLPAFFLETILETDESERTCTGNLGSFDSNDNTSTSSSSSSNLSKRTAVLSEGRMNQTTTILIGQPTIIKEANSKFSPPPSLDNNDEIHYCYIRTSSPVTSDRDDSTSLPTTKMLTTTTGRDVKETLINDTTTTTTTPRYPSSHGCESGFDDEDASLLQQIKRSPGVIGVSALLHKTDNELVSIMTTKTTATTTTTEDEEEDDGPRLPYDMSPSWTPRHRQQQQQQKQELEHGSSTDSLTMPSEYSIGFSRDSQESTTSTPSDCINSIQRLNLEDLPGETLKMIQDEIVIQENYYASDYLTCYCCHSDVPFIDADDVDEDVYTVTDGDHPVIVNRANCDEVSLHSSCDTLTGIKNTTGPERIKARVGGDDECRPREIRVVPSLLQGLWNRLTLPAIPVHNHHHQPSTRNHHHDTRNNNSILSINTNDEPIDRRRGHRRRRPVKTLGFNRFRWLCTCLLDNPNS